MPATRLSPLDDSFLAVESPTAHMHVGWVAAFEPPNGAPTPRFAELRDHIEARLGRAPRYRERIAPVPLGISSPLWVDDDRFDVNRHVVASSARDLTTLVDECMSNQLQRDRPLWQICIADQLEDGRVGVVGKAHHAMVDGIAAVELATLLLDPTPDPPPAEEDGWQAEAGPGAVRRFTNAVLDGVRAPLGLVGLSRRLGRSPQRLLGLPGQAVRAGIAVGEAARPAALVRPLNQPISPARHLARFDRPLEDLKRAGDAFDATINDVLLAASAGGMRRFLEHCDKSPVPLKTMVPVSVRPDGENGQFGNQISFVFIDLPCDEPDPLRRLKRVQAEMGKRKKTGSPEGANVALNAVGYVPRTLRRVVSRLAASPRAFNLTISNIPGPREPMYMLGCELKAAYPVVPLADEHALSIGMTTVRDRACFGLYTDRESLPDGDLLAEAVDASIDELLKLSKPRRRRLFGSR